jgi:hypothetical protein
MPIDEPGHMKLLAAAIEAVEDLHDHASRHHVPPADLEAWRDGLRHLGLILVDVAEDLVDLLQQLDHYSS